MLQNIQKHKLFTAGETVIVAVSGGADSVALLHMLYTHQADLGVNFYVVTVNHGLRPDAAADADLVQAMASRFGLPCITKQVDVMAWAKTEQIGIEHAARMARYEVLAQVARQVGASRVVTAHHANDQAETILMRLLRGSGPVGLQGMVPDAPLPYAPELRLIRPLLTVSREQIITYCAAHNLDYRHDSTNDDTAFLRNRLRHEVLPYLRSTVNPGVDTALLRLGDVLNTDDDYIQQAMQATVLPHIRFQQGRILINRTAFATWHPALQRRAIYFGLTTAFDNVIPTYDHILHAVEVGQRGAVGTLAQMGAGVHMRVDYQVLVIELAGSGTQHDRDYPYLLPADFAAMRFTAPGTVIVHAGVWALDLQQIEKLTLTTLIVPDNATLTLRARRPGDRVLPPGLDGHSQKLKDWLINRKVPQSIRNRLPLLLINEQISAILIKDQWEIMYQSPLSRVNRIYSLIIRKLSAV